MTGDERRTRWENRTAWPLLVASALFLIAYSWSILEPKSPVWLATALNVVLFVVWAAFFVDYVVRLSLSSRKWLFVRKNPIDLASVLFPVARPFRLLRELHRIPLLRGRSPSHVRRRVLIVAGSSVVLFVYVIALAVYQVERDAPHATIVSFGDAVWWACVTMATVGYGDFVPVTVPGRILAVILMMGGVAIVGTASATIVSYITEQSQRLRPPGGHDDHENGRDRRHEPEADPDHVPPA